MTINSRRAGRKSLSGAGKSKQRNISFGEPLDTNLRNYCITYGMDISAFVRLATEKELQFRINNTK